MLQQWQWKARWAPSSSQVELAPTTTGHAGEHQHIDTEMRFEIPETKKVTKQAIGECTLDDLTSEMLSAGRAKELTIIDDNNLGAAGAVTSAEAVCESNSEGEE